MSLLLATRDGEEALDDAEVREQVLIFLLAGHDTTAIALTFALQLLGRHPDAQRLVRTRSRPSRRPRPHRRGLRPALLHDDGAQGGDAALSARLGNRAPDGHGRPGRRLRHPARGRRRGQRAGHAPPPGLLGGPGALRPGALHPGARGRPAPARLLPLRHRPAGVHRAVLLHARGRDRAGDGRPALRAGGPQAAHSPHAQITLPPAEPVPCRLSPR